MKLLIRLSAKAIIAIFIVALLGCGGRSSASKVPKVLKDELQLVIQAYPSWFWNMPSDESQILAVGYSENYFREESSKEQALKNGIENLTKNISTQITGEQGFWNVGAQMAIAGGFEETVDEEILKRVADNHKILHTYKSESMTIFLLSLGEGSGSHRISDEATKPMEVKPKWLMELPKSRGYIYAVGSSSSYFRQTQSWLSAEMNARVALASAMGTKLRSLIRQLDQQVEIIQAAEVKVELNRAQILSRWVDPKAGIYYVLARVSLANNKEAVFRQINAMIASPKAIEREEGLIERAYKELEEEISSLEEKK